MKKILNARFLAVLSAIVISGVFLFQLYAFIKLDSKSAGSDFHLLRSLMYFDQYVVGINHEIVRIPFPPLVYLITGVSYLINGISVESARMVMLFFGVIFLFSMYGIGKELGGDFAGVITLAAAASSAAVLEVSRRFFLDFPQTAMTALAFYLVLKTDSFKNRKYSILLGIGLGLAFLTKWSTAFYLAIPLLWIILPALKDLRKKPLKSLLFLTYLTVMALTALYYYSQFGEHYLNLHSAHHKAWFLYYLAGVIIPSLIYTSISMHMEHKEKSAFNKDLLNKDSAAEEISDTKTSQTPQTLPVSSRITNMGYFVMYFATIAGVWYLSAAGTVLFKLYHESGAPRDLQANLTAIINYMLLGFSFFPFFQLMIAAGIILLIVKHKDYIKTSPLSYILPVNLIFICLLMWRIGFSDFRYYLSIIVFLAAMTGFWIDKLGRAKILAVLIVIPVSLISMLSWMILPDIQHKYRDHFYTVCYYHRLTNWRDIPLFKITHINSPSLSTQNKEMLIHWLNSFEGDNKYGIAAFMFPHNNIDILEKLEVETYKETGRLYEFNFYYYDEWHSHNIRDPFRALIPLLESKHITPDFISRIKNNSDPASHYIYNTLPQHVKDLLAEDGLIPLDEKYLQNELAEHCNNLLMGQKPIDEIIHLDTQERHEIFQRFHWLNLDGDLKGEELICYNRILFDKVFKNEIIITYNPESFTRLDEVQHILLVYNKEQDPSDALMEIEKIFP